MPDPTAKDVAAAYQAHLLLVLAEAAKALAELKAENERLRAELKRRVP